jgi:hypothetical protein
MVKYRFFKKALIIIALLVFTTMTAGYFIRNKVLNHLLEGRLNAVESGTGISISYAEAKFSGFNSIEIHQLNINPPKGDTLLKVDHIKVRFNPIALFAMRLKFGYTEVIRPELTLWRQGTESNYLFLLEQKGRDSIQNSSDTVKINYKGRIDQLFRLIFKYIPKSIHIKDLKADANINQHHIAFNMDELYIDERAFESIAMVTEDSLVEQWNVGGIIQPATGAVGLRLSRSGSHVIKIPYIRDRWGLLLAFDSLSINLRYNNPGGDESHISGNIHTHGQIINHARISPDDVILDSGSANFRLNFGESYAEIDSSTLISYNGQSFHLFARYDNLPEKRIRIHLHEPDFDAATFFESLPQGLFTDLAGIKVKGRLSFLFDFDLNPAQPDSLKFTSWLKSRDFDILKFGNTDFRLINNDFQYSAYENGAVVRSLEVGPGNPNFKRLDQIPKNLQYAIMTSEDGAFFYHNGFLPDAIRESIITNIRQKRFARGGSTISMQLVKNVFLTHSKNITRKIEEMLITWLIESQRLSSKERMLEVYLNIIETGPMIYGVNEAAGFYFNKDVSKLTPAESIFIASIIPRPKWFKYSFDSDGNLREHLKAYYELVSSKMLRKEWISQEDFNGLKAEVELNGPAQKMLAPSDSIPDLDKNLEDIE